MYSLSLLISFSWFSFKNSLPKALSFVQISEISYHRLSFIICHVKLPIFFRSDRTSLPYLSAIPFQLPSSILYFLCFYNFVRLEVLRKCLWKIAGLMEDLFLGSQWSIILGYRRLSVKSFFFSNFSVFFIFYLQFLVSVWRLTWKPKRKSLDQPGLSFLPLSSSLHISWLRNSFLQLFSILFLLFLL